MFARNLYYCTRSAPLTKKNLGMVAMATAAAVIIGNEILSGKFADENSPWLAKRLGTIGVDLMRIAVIPDDISVIADTVREFSTSVTHVFTSGGVGPTHDDVTFEGIARAFGVPLARHPAIATAIRTHMGNSVTEAALRMADVPAGTQLVGEGFPVTVFRNVVILPGVPSYFQKKFDLFARTLTTNPKHSERIVTHARESAIADVLTEATARWPAVEIGSYPRVEERPPTVIVTIDSRDPVSLNEAHSWLKDALHSNSS